MTQLALARPDGAEIRASVRGEGWPVLAFNGATLPLEFWDPVVAETEHALRWLRFDARNVGGTRAAGAFSLEDVAADGIALLDHVGLESAIVVGHAWGGRVGQAQTLLGQTGFDGHDGDSSRLLSRGRYRPARPEKSRHGQRDAESGPPANG